MKYKDCSLPARLFFEIVDKNDYNLLGFGNDKENKEAFEAIFDEYFELTQSPRIKKDMQLRSEIALLNYKIEMLKKTLHYLVNFPMTKTHRIEIIDALSEIGIKIQKDKPLIEQVEKIKQKTIGSLNTKLKLQINFYKKFQQQNEVKTTFEKMIVNFENVLERQISEDITLRKFLAYENAVKEKIAQQKRSK